MPGNPTVDKSCMSVGISVGNSIDKTECKIMLAFHKLVSYRFSRLKYTLHRVLNVVL